MSCFVDALTPMVLMVVVVEVSEGNDDHDNETFRKDDRRKYRSWKASPAVGAEKKTVTASMNASSILVHP